MGDFTTRSLLAHYGTHPLVLDLYLLAKLGPEFYGWEPETLWQEALRVSGAPNISEVNRNKVQAVRTVHLTDNVLKSWPVFEKVIRALNGIVPRFDVMQRPSLAHLLFGVSVIHKLRGGELSDEVIRYCTAALLEEGVVWAPPPLSACNRHLSVVGGPLSKLAEKAWTEGVGKSGDEATQVQWLRLQEAKEYTRRMAGKLLEQTGVIHDALSA